MGEEYSKKFGIGDLVSWVEFDYMDYSTETSEKKTFHGILLALKIKATGGRDVCYAQVMPNTKDTIMEISVIRIRKFGTN